ncbi:MAG TPA: S-layer homology domain-containing protein, partial [Pseudoneobacillus sp.]|nr:S-layer homology domain-containing protein [Pseudoneobacillus sp.]
MRLHKFFNVLVAIALILTLLPLSTKAAETPSVQVVASKTNPAIGEDVTFSVNLKNFNDPSNNLSSFEVKLSYDPAYWDTVTNKVDLGDYLKSLQTSQYEMPMNSISNGTAHFALSIYKNDNVTYFSGDGTLFTFKLRPKQNGLTDVSIAKSLFVQISKPGISVTHVKGNSTLDIGGTTPPPPPPSIPGSEIIPVMPADVDRTQTTSEDGQIKETIGFNGDKAKHTIEQAKKSKSQAVEIQVNGTAKEADYVSFTTSEDTISQLVANNLYLIITSGKGQMELSVDTLKTLKGNVSIDLFLLTDTSKVEATNKLISENVKNGHSIGQPTEIATNFSGKTKITLPLDAEKLPKDAVALAEYLKALGVFVQHSDGSLEYVKGEIQYDKDKKPVAISISVEKFSTFTVVSDMFVKQTYTDDQEISSYAYESVYKAQELGVMAGVNGKFGPAQPVTRAQFTKIIVEMLGEK